MGSTITRYIATITKGDEYHKEGEEHPVMEHLVEQTQKDGLKLDVNEDRWGTVYYHLYPCTIRKVVYNLEPIEITSLPGCEKESIGYDRWDPEYDWKEHWP